MSLRTLSNADIRTRCLPQLRDIRAAIEAGHPDADALAAVEALSGMGGDPDLLAALIDVAADRAGAWLDDADERAWGASVDAAVARGEL